MVGAILLALWWGVVLMVFLPPIALTVSVIALARVPTEMQRRSRWRRLVRVFGVLSVGSAILVLIVILIVHSLSYWPAD